MANAKSNYDGIGSLTCDTAEWDLWKYAQKKEGYSSLAGWMKMVLAARLDDLNTGGAVVLDSMAEELAPMPEFEGKQKRVEVKALPPGMKKQILMYSEGHDLKDWVRELFNWRARRVKQYIEGKDTEIS